LYLSAAFLAVVATAALAAPFSSIWLATVKTTREVLNLYASDKPAGGENAVPTVFVFSTDKLSYSHVGAGQVPTTFNVRFRQVCAGGGWKQVRLPNVYIGDQQWPQAGDGKPILQVDGSLYQATLKVASGKLELNPNLDPVKRCNAVVAAHTFGGKPPAELLQNGFWIRTEEGVRAKLSPGCVKPNKCVGFCEDFYAGTELFWLPVWINCLPTGYKETHRLPPEPHRTKPEGHRLAGVIRLVDLRAVNSPLKHRCPATVVFRGKFQANRAAQGSYRLVGSDGYASPAYPFGLPDDGERSVSWQRRVEVPAAAGGLAAPGAGSWPRKVTGWLQLEVTVAQPEAETRRSERATYEVHCEKPASPQGTIRGT
jgi:hypothetical protein